MITNSNTDSNTNDWHTEAPSSAAIIIVIIVIDNNDNSNNDNICDYTNSNDRARRPEAFVPAGRAFAPGTVLIYI